MRRRALPAVAVLLLAGAASAQTIKVGSLAPPGSPWEQGLRRLAGEWSRISRGRVSLKIYPGGTVGDEDDMLRKIRIGQLNGAALSGPGLSAIVPEVLALQVPRLVSNDRELDTLIEKMTPMFARQFEEKGFELLAWTRAGWAYIFARDPVVWPEDLKRQKLWVWRGSAREAKAWRDMGFEPITLSDADIMVQLESGGVDAFITSPLVAASNQYFALARNMTDLKWAPFVGGLVVSRRAWSSIAADLRPRLAQAALDVTAEYKQQFLGADSKAIAVMEEHGLAVQPVGSDAREAWRELVRKGRDIFLGNKLEMKTYEMALGYLEELRTAHPAR